VLPFVLGVLGFKLFPFVMSFALSFSQYDIISPPQFVGMENYQELVKDPLFHKSLGVTLAFVALTVPMRLAFALFIAHVLNFKLRGINFFRSDFYLPSILGGSIAVSVLWRFIFSQHGLVNIVLGKFGIEPVLWLADESWSMWTIVLLNTWQFGSAMVIFLAALQNVPQSLYEAAEIDGASKMQQFFRITVPLITPVIFFNLIMAVIGSLQILTTPYVMTGGGPARASYFYTMYLYDNAFTHLKMGYASAMAWVQLLIILTLTALAFWSSRKWVHYQGK
jgi:oligogalacturonide transport system permease protein